MLKKLLPASFSLFLVGATGYAWYHYYFQPTTNLDPITISWAVAFATIPLFLVVACSFAVFARQSWIKIVGVLLVIPAIAIWAISLMLLSGEYRIH